LSALASLAAARRPDHATRIEALRPLVESKLAELRQTIELHRAGRATEVRAIVLADRGKAMMDRIRHGCAEIQQVANERVVRYSREARVSANQIGFVGTVGSIGLFALLVLSTTAIQRGTRRRHQLIQELHESEERTNEARDWLQTILSSIGDAVIATDAQGRVTFMNTVAESLTGWRSEQAAGLALEQVFVITNEDTGAPVENPVSKVLRAGNIVGLANHMCLTAKDGRRIPIDDSAAPIREPGGKVTGVVMVFRDVTERKEIEKATLRSIEHFRSMADNAPVLIWISGVDTSRTWFNKPWLDFTGSSGWTENVHPGDLDRCLAACGTAFEARQPFRMEYRLKRHDGRYRWILDHGTPLYGEHDEFTGYIGSCIDITERKEGEEEVRRANEDLSQFAFAASHDLLEPLRMITSYSQLLLRDSRERLGDDAAVYVNFISDGTHRMKDLLSDLLAYTQVTSDGCQPLEPVDLTPIFHLAAANLSGAIKDSEAVVTSDPLPVVSGQRAHFLQLFQNLIGNAIKYRGPDVPRVHVSAEKLDGAWRIAVADNGIGIDPEYHQKIFGVFKRLHGTSIPGTGIGLAICQRVVERYGGKIWVESQENQGATFHFTIPSE
jgi:PAS domain S-box-containing protein